MIDDEYFRSNSSDHMPKRNDAIAAWLRAKREQCPPGSVAWYVVDDLLDEYREKADTGTVLRTPVRRTIEDVATEQDLF